MGPTSMLPLVVPILKQLTHPVQVRIDHRNGTVHFGAQQLESDRVRDHISALARRLTKALHMVQPEVPKQTEAKRLKVCAAFLEGNSSQCLLICFYMMHMCSVHSAEPKAMAVRLQIWYPHDAMT